MTRRVLVLLFLAAVVPIHAAAVNLSFWQRFQLSDDADGSGGPTCGDELLTVTGFVDDGGPQGRTDFTDVEVRLTVPTGVSVVPGSVIVAAGQESSCSLVSGNSTGDRVILARCSFLCSSGYPTCTQNGGTVSARVVIDDPNPSTSASFQWTFDSNEIGPVLAYDLTTRTSPTVVTYPACRLIVPASLYATKDDSLLVDLDGDGLADPGDTLRYTVQVANFGGQNAAGVLFASDAPAGGRLVAGSVTTSSGGNVLDGNDLTDTRVRVDLGTVAPGIPETVRFAVVLDAPAAAGRDRISCQGTVTSSSVSPILTDDPATTGGGADPTVTPLDFDPNLTVTKTASMPSAVPGSRIVWQLAYGNAGRSPATGVVLRETVPDFTHFEAAASTPGWSCADGAGAGTPCTLAVGALGAGASGTAELAVRVLPALPPVAPSTTNRVTISDDGTNGPETDPTDNADEATVALDAAPELVVVKTGPASARPGEVVPFQLHYENQGGQDATGVVLHETVPAWTSFVAGASSPGWSCADRAPSGTDCALALGLVGAGGEGTVAFAVEVVDPLPAGVEQFLNVAAVTRDDDEDPDDGGGDDAVVILDAAPDLFVVKDGPATATPGQTVVYTLLYGNLGSQGAAGVELVEVVPEPAVFAAGASSPGWSCADGAVAGTLCRLAVGELAAGSDGQATFAVRLPATLPAGAETMENLVTVRNDGRDGPDLDPSDNTDGALTTLVAAPNLAVEKDDAGATAGAGELVAYVLRVANVGNQDAAGVVVTDAVPAHASADLAMSTPGWTCNATVPALCSFELGDVAAGAAAPAVTLALVLHDPLPADLTEIVNRAAVADDGAGGPDPDPGNNEATETTPIRQDGEPPPPPPERALLTATLADYLVDDVDGDGRLDAGDVLGYTAFVRNLGPAAAEAVELEIPPDVHTLLEEGRVTTTQGTVEAGARPAEGVVRVALGSLPAGESASLTFEVRLAEPVPADLRRVRAQGALSAANAEATVTDDPDTRIPLDATITPLDDADDGEVHDVPTLSQAGLAVLVVLLGLLAWRRLGRVGMEVVR